MHSEARSGVFADSVENLRGNGMKRLINLMTALSLALYVVPPFVAHAQDYPVAFVGDIQVICLPDAQALCPEGAFCTILTGPDTCQMDAEQAYGNQVAADQAAADQAAADQAAADQAAADQAAADQAAADQAAADQAAADQAAADQAAADQAAADQVAADQAAADQAAADQAAADQAAADQAAADQAASDQAAADQAAADQAAADQAAADQVAADQAAADQAAADQAAAEQAAADQAQSLQTVVVGDKQVVCLLNVESLCPEGAFCITPLTPDSCQADAEQAIALESQADQAAQDEKMAAEQAAAQDAEVIAAAEAAQQQAEAAAAADPTLVPVEALVAEPQAVDALAGVLAAPQAPTQDALEPMVAVAAAAKSLDIMTPPQADAPQPAGVTVTTETVTTTVTRTSSQEFQPAPVKMGNAKKSHLSDLEKVGLVALGALVIGAMINDNRQQVVSNSGDRVVVRQYDGSYLVYKDDDALLRQPGSTVTTQTFPDGSTRVIVERPDGSQIVTIRDASGRALQRVAYDRRGRATVLIDDVQPEIWVDVRDLPRPRPTRATIDLEGQNAALQAALATVDAQELGRKFSLRQIRTIPQVRNLAPTINMSGITFASNSAAIDPSEAAKLNKLGNFIMDRIGENPGEVFLIEGHTDAVGAAAANLALSDRRAESVAKALTEYFGVPPENMVVQGYGEAELLVPSQGDERANRRVAVRMITALLQQAVR